jgi:hypothetical protein
MMVNLKAYYAPAMRLFLFLKNLNIDFFSKRSYSFVIYLNHHLLLLPYWNKHIDNDLVFCMEVKVLPWSRFAALMRN